VAGVGFSDGDKGDITISSTGTVLTIDNDAVTYAKIQNVSATDRLLGRSSAGAGDVEEITCTSFGRSLIDDANAEAARTTLSVQPTAGPSFTAGITVTQAMASPTVVLRNTAADATDKAAQVVGAHYTATEETVQGIGIYSTATENLVAIGGGSALSNAASEVRLYTAANATTTTGTIRLTISSTGTATFTGQIVGQAGAAITGAATCENSGNVVPLTVTNTGTANSFVVNDASGDTSPFVIDASGQVGIGTSAPQRKLHIANDGAEGLEFFVGIFSGESRINAFNRSSSSWNKFSIGCSTLEFFVGSGGTSALAISSTGTATFAGQIVGQSGAAITGNATITASSGIPLTLNGNSTALRIEEGAGETIDIYRNVSDGLCYFDANQQTFSGFVFRTTPTGGSVTTRLTISSTGTATFAGQILADDIDTANSVAYGFDGDPDTGIGRRGANILTFVTNGTERVRVDASGNVGIGGSPSSPCHIRANNADDGVLHVEQDGTGSASVRCDYDGTGARSWIFGTAGSGYRGGGFGGEFFLYDETATAERIRVNSTGEVIVGVTDQGAYNLQCNGTGVWGAGAYVNGSDERIKNDIAPLSSCTDVIEALRPVTFRYKESWSKDQSIQPGFIAQDLQQALAGQPYLDGVVQQGTEYLSVAYQTLIPLLVKALQESNARIAALEERING
jgi:hypothetical protein